MEWDSFCVCGLIMVQVLGVSLWSKINGLERRLCVGTEYLRPLKKY